MTIKYLDSKRISIAPAEYKVHTFTSTGNTTFAVTGSGDIEYLVIAGGGASGNGAGGGGGAGGFRTNVSGATSGGGSSAESTYGVTAQNYTITVGAGGTGNSTSNCGNSGANSSIVPASGTSIISLGGAGAGGGNAPATLLSGGSGGGSGDVPRTGGLGTAGQGYNGGTTASQTPPYPASGGGGAGGVGGGAPSSSAGGLGLASSIQTGSPIFYAGGGGGSNSGVGHSGGGNGTAYPNDGNDATANSGSGGGGAGGSTGSGATNGSGGSGIVIVRYLTSSGITATGGTITTTSVAQTKPTNVQDNSILVEPSTARRYWFDLGVEPKGTSGSGGDWAETSFNNSTIVNNESASGNVVTRTSGSGWNSYIRSNEYISPSTGGGEIYFTQSANTNISVGLEKSPFNPAPSATYTGKDYSFHTTSSSNNMYEHTSDYAGTAWASATNEYRITMDSAGLVKYYWRSGSSGAWTLERTSTVTASGDYYMAVSPAAGTTTCFIKGTPATWTMEPTFEDDFSTDKGWTNLTSNTSVTTQLNYTETNSTYIRATKDLQDSNALGSGNNMSDNFVIRFELNKTNDATNTANGTQPLIGISSATTDGWFNNQDSIGMILSQDTNQTHSIRAVGADNQYTHQGDSADAAYTWTTGIRYCEVIKNATADTVTATIYTNSDYTGSLVTATVSTSGKTFSGLRYLSMRNFADNARSSTVWEMNNVQVYDGVTTVN